VVSQRRPYVTLNDGPMIKTEPNDFSECLRSRTVSVAKDNFEVSNKEKVL
jgi:hypothetical protein